MQLLHFCLITTLAAASVAVQLSSLNGLMCMKSEFVENRTNVRSEVECAYLCDSRQNCQAFSMADGPCQLFVFDRCSKYVRDCSCSRRAQVFVRQQPGLPPGALCPAGYGDDLCGTKYKTFSTITNWDTGKAAIEAEPGLVIMADAIDAQEMEHLKTYFFNKSLTDVFLGGRQLPGSAEPSGGWFWTSCNITISSSLWSAGEPNNAGGTECVTLSGTNPVGLNDGNLNLPTPSPAVGTIGECVSPFD